MSIPLENTAIPHFYGEIINYLRKGDFKKSKYFFMILLGIWIVIQILNLGNSYLNTYLMPNFQSFIRQYFFNFHTIWKFSTPPVESLWCAYGRS